MIARIDFFLFKEVLLVENRWVFWWFATSNRIWSQNFINFVQLMRVRFFQMQELFDVLLIVNIVDWNLVHLVLFFALLLIGKYIRVSHHNFYKAIKFQAIYSFLPVLCCRLLETDSTDIGASKFDPPFYLSDFFLNSNWTLPVLLSGFQFLFRK